MRYGSPDQTNDQARYAYHALGAPVTGLPVLGDTTQRLIDAADVRVVQNGDAATYLGRD
ncbi:hypothetical protein ACFRH6_15570 [Streptomyces sp. NPDC056749]|uniref:hypothetical protein n=1 Tax=Streptomyces sp. NPDC056749 TaxID=3345936 RepID=UPI0036D184BF